MGKWNVVGRTVACILVATLSVAAESNYLSPQSVVAHPDGKLLYIAAHTADQVLAVDAGSGKVKQKMKLPAAPTGLALSAKGDVLYVTAGVGEGQLHVLNAKSGKVTASIAAGHSPVAPTLSPDGNMLYLCSQYENTVLALDLAAQKCVAEIEVAREPNATAITPDGALLLVANQLPSGAADGDYAAAVVSLINTTNNTLAAEVALPNGSMALKGVCVSPDGKFAYITHILARYQLPTTQLERGWVNTNALTIVDMAAKTRVNTVLLDDVDRGAANPWGVACSADGATLYVAHMGTHELSVIDLAGLHARLGKVAAGEKVNDVSRKPDDVPNDLSFLVDVRKRIKLKGSSPRDLAVIGDTIYIAEYYSDSLATVTLSKDKRPEVQSLALAKEQTLSQVRMGAKLFHDADICFQQWQSCTTCHPDVRTDGLNWDLLNDGIGNPKNTKSLLYSHATPPSMITGIRADAETAVRAGIRHILFAVRPSEDSEAMDAYLKSLKPLPSPHLVKGEMSDAAKRGEKIFEKANCASCHSGEYYTNLKKFNVGTGLGREIDWEFDTPTLLEGWRTAPYLHDGRAATMMEVLTIYNAGDRHGKTSDLTLAEMEDLVAFLLSL